MFRVIGAVVLLVIAGCGTAPAGEGVVPAQLGREIQIRATGSPTLATMWLDSVKPVTCTEPGSLPPNRGHYLAATIVLQTTEDYEPDWGWWMSASDFSTIDSNGQENGRGIITSCLPDSHYLVDDFYLSDSGYYGVVLLDSAAEHGTLVYSPHNLAGDTEGWSWEF
ncbi:MULTISPECIES: hypothetical protein [Actinokineospora]|uniref:Uncharacterized protein n=1 Tax=Actinokineospora fastidiosa TaxID=1816 RepID=A0A918G337_9PSEU|nr:MULTISPECIES: hypothetical protein [Actinokineospora]UVS76952.1 hypothetical protein Actkin_00649 [Actinokineospora sp. UTMC 2448]GGS14606.1 hypothetical protein GCM10010171_03140 [Actinokineospora fastidiosa]